MPSLFIEGWRFSPTSYAVVNQHHMLEILKRPQIDLYFRDIPFFTPVWRHMRGLFPAEQEKQIEALREPGADTPLDVSIRMAHPTVVTPTRAKQPWCWIVTEFGILEQSRIGDGRPASEALRTPGIRLMTPSNWAKEGLVRTGADPGNISIVPHGYDPTMLHPLAEDERQRRRAALGWSGRFVFLNVSTLVWNKGISSLLQAFGMIVQKYPEALLVIKGSDQMLQSDHRLRDALSKIPSDLAHRAAANIRYLGQELTFAQLAEFFKCADAYVAPYHAEGFNMPVMEAAACGVPVICTGGGPTDDFTTSDFCLRINSTPMTTPELEKYHGPGARILQVDGLHLVELMERVITDEPFRRRARESGPAFLSQRYTWSHIADQFLSALFGAEWKK